MVAEKFTPVGGTHHFSCTSTTGFSSSVNSNSAYFTPSNAPKDQSITISYYYETQEGCTSVTISKQTIVYTTPTVDFTIRSNYNYVEEPVVLSGNPSNSESYFVGELIEETATLNPSRAVSTGLGIPITYTYKDQTTGCSNSKSHNTIVYKASEPIKTISPLADLQGTYCYDDITLDISWYSQNWSNNVPRHICK